MNCARMYLRDVTGAEGNPEANWTSQKEVSHSLPNEAQPTTTFEIPPQYEVIKVVTVAGYGNTDTFIYVEKVKDAPVAKVLPNTVQKEVPKVVSGLR